MTPTEINLVARSWTRCRADHGLLRNRIAATLGLDQPGFGPDHLDTAARIIETVDHLQPLLAHPAAMTRAAAALIGDRAATTLAHRRVNETALLAGMVAVGGPLGAGERAAWHAAFELFDEILAALLLRPFGPEQPGPPAAPVAGPACPRPGDGEQVR